MTTMIEAWYDNEQITDSNNRRKQKAFCTFADLPDHHFAERDIPWNCDVPGSEYENWEEMGL